MPAWAEWLIAFGAALVWMFFGTRVKEIMNVRHVEEHCKNYIDDGHGWGIFFGYIFGPFMYLLVVVYQLADGTTKRHFKQWQKERKSRTSA